MNNPEQYDRIINVVVDVQNDFCPGGALAVTEGDQVVTPINAVNERVRELGGLVVFTQDQHPIVTNHFNAWPVHCVKDTEGGQLRADLNVETEDVLVAKGTGTEDDGYSGFEGQTADGTTLYDIVTPKEGERVALLIGGLATDYCVKATVLDGCELADKVTFENHGRKLDVYVIRDAIRAVNLQPTDDKRAQDLMKLHGAQFVTAQEIVDGAVAQVGV